MLAVYKIHLVSLCLGTALGSFIGLYFLRSVDNKILIKALGVLVILFAMNLLRKNPSIDRTISTWWGPVCGTMGGILGGLFGTSSPPMIWYLAKKLSDKETLRATMIGLFAVDFMWRLSIYAYSGLVTVEMMKLALSLSFALIAGTILGHRVQLKISEEKFLNIVVVLLCGSGMLLLFK